MRRNGNVLLSTAKGHIGSETVTRFSFELVLFSTPVQITPFSSSNLDCTGSSRISAFAKVTILSFSTVGCGVNALPNGGVGNDSLA